jgi:hypothetical protein
MNTGNIGAKPAAAEAPPVEVDETAWRQTDIEDFAPTLARPPRFTPEHVLISSSVSGRGVMTMGYRFRFMLRLEMTRHRLASISTHLGFVHVLSDDEDELYRQAEANLRRVHELNELADAIIAALPDPGTSALSAGRRAPSR